MIQTHHFKRLTNLLQIKSLIVSFPQILNTQLQNEGGDIDFPEKERIIKKHYE